MRPIEPSQFRNLVIENVVSGAAAEECALSRASIEFLCDRVLEQDESMCVPIAVSEFSLADLVGQPACSGALNSATAAPSSGTG